MLEQLAFNAQKFRAHVTMARPLFEQFLRDCVRTVSGNMQVKFDVHISNHVAAISV